MSAPTFTQALAQAEVLARQSLDASLHERLSCAMALVKEGRVFQTSAGDWQVDSTSREGVLHAVGGVCPCEDVRFNHPQGGLCKHRIAVYLARKVQALMREPAPVCVSVEPWPDNDPEPFQLPQDATTSTGTTSGTAPVSNASTRPLGAPTALPEAPASVNVHLTIAGRQVQLTLRDTSEERLLVRLQTVLELYPVVQASSQPQPQVGPQQLGKDFCAIHNVPMKWNTGKEGRKGWFSHKSPEGSWCTGKVRR